MEKDVKIGLVIGLIFVVALIAFFAYRQHSQGPTPPPVTKETVSTNDNTALQNFQNQFGQNLTGAPSANDNTMTGAATAPTAPPTATTTPTTPAATTAPPMTSATESTTYVVKQGDSLWKIADQFYHDGTKGKVIADANKDVIKNADDLAVGMKLTIPPAPEKTADESTATKTTATDTGTGHTPATTQKHKVAKGDTLYSLAKEYLGDGDKWKAIVDANPGLDPNSLPVGKTIIIPAAPKKHHTTKATKTSTTTQTETTPAAPEEAAPAPAPVETPPAPAPAPTSP